jgi:hypothetical protein
MTVRTQRSQETQAEPTEAEAKPESTNHRRMAQPEPTEGEAKPESTNHRRWRSEGAM